MNDRELAQVRHDNIRDHQIGGITDGISTETAEDLGFYPPDRYDAPADTVTAQPAPRAGTPDSRIPEARNDYRSNIPLEEEVTAGRAAIAALRSQRESGQRQGDR